MRRQLRADAAMAVTILVLAAALAASGLVVLQRWLQQDHLRRAFGFEDGLGALAAIVGAAVVIWWLVSLLLAVLSGLLALNGRRRSAELTARLSPRFMRRLVLALLGFNLLATPLAQASEPPVSPLWQPGDQVASAPAQPPSVSPLWQPQAPLVSPGPLARPESRSFFARSIAAGGPRTASPTGTGTGTTVADPAARSGTGTPPVPTVGSGTGTPPVPTPGSGSGAAAPGAASGTRPVIGPGTDVVVRSGDTLWTLAAEQLGPLATDLEIAEQWPRWFQLNRAVIGDDPSLLLPGQILRAP